MIHIACNIDRNYVRHCAVTLVSVFENNRGQEVTVHLLTDDLDEAEKSLLEGLCGRYGQKIRFYRPDWELLRGFCIRKFSKRITMATYYRCLLSEVLPESVDRLLYLDCDIVVRGDLRPFYDMPLDGVGVAAVEDIGSGEAERYEVLHYPMEDAYFNAGVLLVNMDYWRSHGVPQQCADYYRKYPERILFNDQDLLNSVLHKDKKLVDLTWNAQDGFYRASLDEGRRRRYADTLLDPVILHYTNRKPWEYDSLHPLREEYRRYLDLTPWRGDYPWTTPGNRVRRFFHLLPFTIGLRRPKYVRLENMRE